MVLLFHAGTSYGLHMPRPMLRALVTEKFGESC